MMLRHIDQARFAGILYLLLAILGPFNSVYVPRAFIVPADAAATARNITSAPLVYRLGIVSEVAVDVIFLVLVLTLYDLLRDVGRQYARAMVVLVSVGVAAGVVNLLTQMAPLILLGKGDFLAAFTRPQLEALALSCLKLHSAGAEIDFIFWGLWLFPFGVLVFKSSSIPRFIGVLLVVGCFAYLASSITSLLAPAQAAAVSRVAIPLALPGELLIIVWLLARGGRLDPRLVWRPESGPAMQGAPSTSGRATKGEPS